MNRIIYFWVLLGWLSCGALFGQKNIVILHTNDTHSRIEPLPETDKHNAGKGGVIYRDGYVKEVKSENKNVLLFDAGDFLQGTPYFNMFKGRVEIEAMNIIGYDAATLGNHEFDYGLDALKDAIERAKFPIVSSNYDFSETSLAGMIDRYVVFERDGVKIGVIGINVRPNGLISSANYGKMRFEDPTKTANEVASLLKTSEACDMVVCLSHLGYTSDLELAENTRDIDIIIGGHSHTYMKEPKKVMNAAGKWVTVTQTGGKGVMVGRLDISLKEAE